MAPGTTKTLLLEDDDGHAHLVFRALSHTNRAFEVHRASSVAAAIDYLGSSKVDVILADLNLPDCSGMETVAAIHQHANGAALVVLTSLDDERMARDSLERGAQDYLVKCSLTPELLERTLCYAIHRENSISEKAELLDQLQQQQDMLQRKNRRLARLYKTAQRFVDDLSHDFRTPLTVIKEYASLVNDGVVGPVTAEQRRLIDVISDRADDLNRMVDDMLDVTKINSGLMGVYRRSCRVADIVRHLRPGLERKAALKNVELSVDLQPDLPSVYCDDDKIGRVLSNLLVNAIKFCGDPGKVCLRATCQPGADEVTFEVIDNGQGIEPKALEAIFLRFNQTGGLLHNSTRGYGLGLNIARELVSLNLGTISVDSRLGQGSRFSFTTPTLVPTNIFRRYLVQLRQQKNPPTEIALVVAAISDSNSISVAQQTDSFLSYLLRRGDLLLRMAPTRWVVAIDRPATEAKCFIRRARQARRKANRNIVGELIPKIEWTYHSSHTIDDLLGESSLALETLLSAGSCVNA